MPRTVAVRRASFDPRLALGAILLVAVVLRLETISAHLSDAEGYSYLVGSAPSGHAFLARLAAYENTPPSFYALLTPLPLGHTASLRIPAMVPGVLIVGALWAALRRPFGGRAALLAGLAVAVAPYAVSYSDYARGFMLAGLGSVVALWAMLRLIDGGSRRWSWVYAAGGVLAVYSEYYAAVFLLALALSAVAVDARESAWGARARRFGFAILPIASLLPWIPEIVRAQDAVNRTKTTPVFPGPSPASLRDVAARLTFGEHGAPTAAAGRWLESLVIAGVLVATAIMLRRASAPDRSDSQRRSLALIAWTMALTLIGHSLAPIVGVHIFNERYLTMLIPLGATLIAVAVLRAGVRWLPGAVGCLLLAVGLAVFVQRFDRQYEPDVNPVRLAAEALHPRAVLTNSAVVAYYLRGLRPIVDRPFGLGPDHEASCQHPCLIVDDTRVAGGARPGPGPRGQIGPFSLRLLAAAP